jgi:hypothetical protein
MLARSTKKIAMIEVCELQTLIVNEKEKDDPC